MIPNILLWVAIAAIVADMLAVYKRDVMMLQQNSYRRERYAKWFSRTGESTNMGRIGCCIALMCMLIHRLPAGIDCIPAIAICVWQLIWLTRQKYKKPLVWTPRARRIYATMWVLTAVIATVCGLVWGVAAIAISLITLAVVSPIVLIGANDLLAPVEKAINRKYYNEAASILASMPSLKIIGITGSYGKTSTKHFLHRLLSEHFATTMTPGSFNTTLGVIRTVREHLRPYDEVLIVEMGAKQSGDIREICDLVHPSVGIITAVGPQHLESFKTIENVQATKFELADALPADGLAVLNNDFPYVANRPVTNTRAVRYTAAGQPEAEFRATDIEYLPTGTRFRVEGPGLVEPLTIETPILGECNVSNLLAAVIVALHLGVPADKIAYAAALIEPVEHRLSLRRTPGGVTVIDDAFNSNPDGSRMALDVLAGMKGGKRIIITPGMIELGDLQQQANEEFGRHIARSADVAIVVGEYNRAAILAGLAQGPIKEENIHAVDSFASAQQLLQTIMKAGDTVLYENDLPDTFK